MQELCRRNLAWDDPIPQDLLEETIKWMEGVESLKEVKVERCIKPNHANGQAQLELHTFADASEYEYGAGVYARCKVGNQVKVQLLFGKSRVAPIQTVSVPRLELTAAVVACQCYQFVVNELDTQVNASFFWTDSQTVLKYLANTATRFKTFVAHRVAAIHEISDVSQWNYSPSSKNPADHASRGVWPQEMCKIQHWLKGPDFLTEDIKNY